MSEPGEAKEHPAEKKSREDAILAKAHAIKTWRGQGLVSDEAPPPPSTRFSHWNYLMFEAQWLSKDIVQERIWKKKVAYMLAHQIANTKITLRPVPKPDADREEPAEGSLSGGRRGARPRASTPRARKVPKLKATSCADDVENEDAANEIDSGPRRFCDAGAPPANFGLHVHLSYKFHPSWPKSVRDLIFRKDDEIIIAKLVAQQDYEAEYELAKAEVEEGWRDAAIKAAAEQAALKASQATAAAALDGGAASRKRSNRGKLPAQYDDMEGVFDQRTSSRMTGPLDENDAAYRRVAARHASKRARPTDSEDATPKLMRRSGALMSALRHNVQEWRSEDDQLLCCIMSEFGDNSALVADVYVSTRRLHGLHCDTKITEKRIRELVNERSSANDFPVAKAEARDFLQQSIPCMATSVRKYQAAIAPIAHRVVEQQKAEEKQGREKRLSFCVSPQAPKHATHDVFLRSALQAFNGCTPDPQTVIQRLRGGPAAAALRPGALPYPAPMSGDTQPAMQPFAMPAIPEGAQPLTPKQLQQYQQQHQKYLAQMQAAGVPPPMPSLPPGAVAASAALPRSGVTVPPGVNGMGHLARPPGSLSASQYPTTQQLPPSSGAPPGMPGYGLPPPAMMHAMRPGGPAAGAVPNAAPALPAHGVPPSLSPTARNGAAALQRYSQAQQKYVLGMTPPGASHVPPNSVRQVPGSGSGSLGPDGSQGGSAHHSMSGATNSQPHMSVSQG